MNENIQTFDECPLEHPHEGVCITTITMVDVQDTPAPVLYCDHRDVADDDAFDVTDCMNAATGAIIVPVNDAIGDDLAGYETFVILHCDEHAPEMMHELKQTVGRDEAIFTASLSDIRQVQ
jgi:hypothetical protein